MFFLFVTAYLPVTLFMLSLGELVLFLLVCLPRRVKPVSPGPHVKTDTVKNGNPKRPRKDKWILQNQIRVFFTTRMSALKLCHKICVTICRTKLLLTCDVHICFLPKNCKYAINTDRVLLLIVKNKKEIFAFWC